MILRKLKAGDPEVDIITELNIEAFPPEEHTEIDLIYDFGNDALDLLGIYREEAPDKFTGYFLCIKNEKTVYISYFAICPELRSLGIGTKALSALREFYSGKQIVLYFENIFEECGNLEQRRRRREFYLRNGFYETGWFLTANGVNFEIVCSSADFNKDSYLNIIEISHSRIPAYNPKLYRLDK